MYPPIGEDDGPPPDAPAPFPSAVLPGDFQQALDKPFIRGLQTWLDDAAFETKWTASLQSPIAFLGSADSAFHADLASRTLPLPGSEVICHGDAKLDNFGWIFEDSTISFSDGDFDDAGHCPAAADILHFIVATDLLFADPALDRQAIDAYVAAASNWNDSIGIDPSTMPDFEALRNDGVDHATKDGKLKLGGDLVAVTSDERTALTALVAAEARLPTTIYDMAREIRSDGGSAGLRRYWLFVLGLDSLRTIIELKELAPPGTELGWHSTPLVNRFGVLKRFWWGAFADTDHFEVTLLGGRFVARDRFRRQSLDPEALSVAVRANAIQSEASLLAIRHMTAWKGDLAPLRAWLETSSQTLIARWREAYASAGGTN